MNLNKRQCSESTCRLWWIKSAAKPFGTEHTLPWCCHACHHHPEDHGLHKLLWKKHKSGHCISSSQQSMLHPWLCRAASWCSGGHLGLQQTKALLANNSGRYYLSMISWLRTQIHHCWWSWQNAETTRIGIEAKLTVVIHTYSNNIIMHARLQKLILLSNTIVLLRYTWVCCVHARDCRVGLILLASLPDLLRQVIAILGHKFQVCQLSGLWVNLVCLKPLE